MRVLNKPVINNLYRETCDKCGAELEFSQEDIFSGAFGCAYVLCPVCNNSVWAGQATEDGLGKTLTVENISFPQDFADSGNAVKIGDEEINEIIKKCLKSLENAEEDWGVAAQGGTGDTAVFVFKYEDEYDISVARNYWETSIPRG